MKKVLVLFMLIQSTLLWAQVNFKEINKSLAKLDDSLYISKFELSNKEYNLFIADLRKNNLIESLLIALPDTANWTKQSSFNSPYMTYYHKHPAYQNYPAVNISYEAAKLYCDWLSKQYASQKNPKYKGLIFRLPSEKEWELAAQAKNVNAIYGWGKDGIRNKNGEYNANFRREVSTQNDSKTQNAVESADVTAPVSGYYPNVFGIYNMSGNVAEMTDDANVAKGGSWNLSEDYLAISKRSPFDGKATPFVGFRYVAEIRKY